MVKKRDFFGEWLESSYVDGQYTVPIFWTEFKRLFRALWVGIRYQPALTLVCLIGALSTPYVATNFAGGFTSKQANYNQPMPGIVAGQTGAFARTVLDVGGACFQQHYSIR
ncbi:hypothetical protein PMG71_09565 [Roseofilum sp. BLCC_M154]|uniref:Uncharacterized protein n=1 Tax=Roseofilum acuticapitatum BLCC-M154 TaxID=3022444 RepID=A0ABT7AUC3_9CYAN|nr:hypothetical protein [Roseofilum acuticapitatum]MDJ1169673.1 hypothetical protein [Roseofilum acuticapitatum BLCC-M154]